VFGLFRRAKPVGGDRLDALKSIVRERLGLDDAAVVSISEIQCGDPACPGNETVILVMRPKRRTAAYRVPAPLSEVGPEDIEAALREEPPSSTPAPPPPPPRP
jgi:hypothetical protein